MSSRGVRVLRGLTAAGIAVFVAAFSHAAAGGGAPGAAGLALALALSVVVCVVLARRRLSLAALAVSVLISQFALHLLFEVGTAPGSGSGFELTESGHHGHVVLTMATDASTATAHPGHDSGWMWVGHAAAAVVTIALLHRGELTLRKLLVLARTRFGAYWALVRLAVASISAAPNRGASLARADGLPIVDQLRDLGVLLGSRRHRGPPATVAAHI